VPGGVGVREAAFVALANLPAGVGVTTALVARLLFMLVDGAGAGLAASLRRPGARGDDGPRDGTDDTADVEVP
jgi:hypothetical protein